MRKVLAIVGVVFLCYFVVTNPAGAAHAVKSIGGMLVSLGDGVAAFFTAVAA